MKMVALIPARAGSKRVPGKNIRPLAGHPLIAWTIAAAQQSGVFWAIIVCTDDLDSTGQIAHRAGCEVIQRQDDDCADDAPDIRWVQRVNLSGAEAFAILRPTSPFRTAATIRRAYKQFMSQEVHSIRAVEPVKQHPGKMWGLHNGCLTPIAPLFHPDGTPWHSSPTQTLPPVYVQNASLEMAWTYVVKSFGTISGTKIAPFFTTGYEGFDINTEDDWRDAELLIAEGYVTLPSLAAV